MKKIFLALLVLSLNAYSQTKSQTKNQTSTFISNRENKDFTLAVQIFGHGPSALIVQGLQMGFFLDRDSQITVDLLNGNNPLIWGSGNFEIQSWVLSAHYKYFFGPTFFTRLGLDYKRIDYSYSDSMFGTGYEQSDFKGNSIGFGAYIGNQWQWDTVTFGVDWIGISMPFASQIESSSAGGSSPNPMRIERDQTRYLKDNVLILSRLFVGATF